MFFRRRGQEPQYPNVPDRLVVTMHEDQLDRNRADHYTTPYLSLRARLSQIWINRWTVLLLLVLVRVLLLVTQLRDNVGDAKTKALSACTKVEDIGSSMASMPHYLSAGVNDLTATGVEKSIHAMVEMLDLVIQGVEAIIIFYINFLVGTYVCLITALIHGSLSVVESVTKDATKAFNNIIDSATSEIEDISSDLEKGINKITDGIENSIIGNLIPDVPKVDFSKPIDKLKDFDLNSDDFVKDVHKLNDDLPDFDQVQNLTKEAISVPFNLVRKMLNESYGDYKFDRDVFPLAKKKELTFCSDNDVLRNFFEHLFNLIRKSRIIAIVILVLLAVAAMIPMAWLEIHRWRKQQGWAKMMTENQDPSKNQHLSMDFVYIVSRPITAAAGLKIARRVSVKRQMLTRWFVAYATSPAALFILSLAVAGLFSCFCQFLLLKAVQKEVPTLADKVSGFADDVVTSLETVSGDWANDANGVIKGFNKDVNDDVLGYVTNATDAVNDTLTVFLDKMEDALELVFKDTVLLNPVRAVVHCVIGIKIESVQKGLTWVHDHAHVDFPLFPDDVFSQGAKESVDGDSSLQTFLASPSSVTTDEVTGAVKHVVDWLHNNIVQEALISTVLLLVYVIVVFIGISRTLAGMAMPDKAPRGTQGAHGGGDEAYNSYPPPPSPPPGPVEAYQRPESEMYNEKRAPPYSGHRI